MFQILVIFLCCMIGMSSGFHVGSKTFQWRSIKSKTLLNEVPLELTGRLDPSRKWDVTLEFNGVEKVVSVSEGDSILEVAEKNFKGNRGFVDIHYSWYFVC